MRQTYRLTSMLLRAYVRDRIALFFSLIVPLMLMVIFGYLNLGDFGRVSIAVDDQAKNAASQQLTGVLRGIGTLQVAELSTDEALDEIRRGRGTQFVPAVVDAFFSAARRHAAELGLAKPLEAVRSVS